MPIRLLIAITLICMGHFAAAATFEDSMAQRTKACTGCHGDQGRAGPDGYYPRLAGKPAGYLYNQLLNIRDGRRHYRPMASLLEPLSDAYLLEMAQYFSALNVPYPAPAPSAATQDVMARGRTLVTQGDTSRGIPPCQQCHGDALTGTAPHVPGLLGLPRDYLNAQLGGWRTGLRRAQSPDCMGHIASRLSSDDVTALTHWLAAQPLPANTHPQAQMRAWPTGTQEMSCGSATPVPGPTTAPKTLTAFEAQGAYLARVGNCQSCHTAPGGLPYAGGRAIDTPFGTAFSSNLTTDTATGLGKWRADDFWQALHHGKSRDGRLLNPAFPYTEYSLVTRADSDAMFAYFKTLAPVSAPNQPHDMQWPFGTQAALLAWRTVFFNPQVDVFDAAQSTQWNRGAYLVNGLGHCGSCHTPRNAMGASQRNKALRGGLIPVQNWYAPSLTAPAAGATDAHNQADTLKLLKTGVSAHGTANGPMALVVQGSTQHMTDADLLAMAVYLRSIGEAAPARVNSVTTTANTVLTQRHAGSALYDAHCADCHGTRGQGVAGAYPALAGNGAVLLEDNSNLIQTVLHGGFAPVTAGNPRPFGMPPFVLELGDQDIAQVLSFVRTAWGNQAKMVTTQNVSRLRDKQTH